MRKLIVMGVLALSLAVAGPALAADEDEEVAGPAYVSDGAAIFRLKCLGCHGPKGRGTEIAPAFRGNEFIKNSEIEVITDIVKNGRPLAQKRYEEYFITMLPQKDTLTDDEIVAVTKYLKSLAK